MTALPLKTAISDTYPNPSNATARAGFAQLWDAINETLEKPELDLASGTTCDIGGQLSTKLRITGTTTITSFGTNYRGPIQLRFADAVTITHNSTTLICPGGVSITTKAEDAFIAWPKATSGVSDGWLIVKTSFSSATTSTQGVVELATNTEALAGSDTARAVTSAGLASSKSYGANGYQKFPGGLIIQWGMSGASVAGTAVTFPLTFPTSIYAVVIGQQNVSNEHSVGGVSLSGFTFYAGATTTQNFWIALGV